MLEIDSNVDDLKFRNANIFEVCEDNVLAVDLYYPRQEKFDTIQLDIVSTRGNDDIRISYDFNRGGWIIKKREFYQEIENYFEKWEEVYFIKCGK